MPIVEIRTYRLLPGERTEFVRVMREESVPLLRARGIQVLDCGASLVDEDGHEEAYLIRGFDSLDQHREQEDSFYASPAWREGPREAIVSRIESAHSIVIEVTGAALNALRR